MNLVAHNPEFSGGCSITELLSRVATQSSQLVSANKQIVDLTGQLDNANEQISDLTRQLAEEKEQSAKEKTALSQRIDELERSATLDSNNSCKPPSSDGLRKSNGKKTKTRKQTRTRKSGQIACARNQAASPAASRAIRAGRSNRSTNRTRLLISCRRNARIVKLNGSIRVLYANPPCIRC